MKSIELDQNFLEAWAHLTQVSTSYYYVLPGETQDIYLVTKKDMLHINVMSMSMSGCNIYK